MSLSFSSEARSRVRENILNALTDSGLSLADAAARADQMMPTLDQPIPSEPADAPAGKLNVSVDGWTQGNGDARRGALVPIGAYAWQNMTEGYVIGGDNELCIIRSEHDGLEYAERWGCVQVQAKGPAWPVEQPTGTGGGVSDKRSADPFYELSNQVEALLDHVDRQLETLQSQLEDYSPRHRTADLAETHIEQHFREIYSLLNGLSADHRRAWLDGAFDAASQKGGDADE